MMRRFLGKFRLLFKTFDAPILVYFDYTELFGGFTGGNLDGGYRYVCSGVHMLLEHFGVVHFVDVIAREDENVFGTFAADGIDVLVDRVRRALIPLFGDAHLRREDFDVIAETRERRPASANVAIEA